MSGYYAKVGEVGEPFLSRAIAIAGNVKWTPHKGENTNYDTSFDGQEAFKREPELNERWAVDIWKSAFLLRLEPGGWIHKHSDRGNLWSTYHIVLLTNDDCINTIWQGTLQHDFRLKAGGIYRVDRTNPHESVNNGATERIHLLMEVRDAQNKFVSGPPERYENRAKKARRA